MSSISQEGREIGISRAIRPTLFTITFILCLLPLSLVQGESPSGIPSPLDVPPPIPPTATPANGVTLEACYQEAIRNDPAIRQARAAFEQAIGEKITLQSIALPRLNITTDAGDQGPRYNTALPHDQLFLLATSTLNQPIFNAAIPPSFRLGRVNVAIAEQQLNRTITNELYEIRISFYNALTARAGIEVQKDLESRLRANLKEQQDRFTVGKVSHNAVSLASYQLAAIAPGLAKERSAYRESQIGLAQRLGRDLGAATATDADSGLPYPIGTLDPTPLSIDIEKETSYALSHRADLEALRLLIDSTQQTKEITEAGAYPTVSLIGSLQFIPESLIHKSGTIAQKGALYQDTQSIYGVTSTWTMSDGGLIKGHSAEFQAKKEGYQITLKQLEETVPLQLRQIEGSLKQAAAQLQDSEANVSLAEENFHQVEAQVNNGDLPQLDFLNAQSNLLQARFNRINALLENSTAIADLDVVTGRYLEFLTVDASGKPRNP